VFNPSPGTITHLPFLYILLIRMAIFQEVLINYIHITWLYSDEFYLLTGRESFDMFRIANLHICRSADAVSLYSKLPSLTFPALGQTKRQHHIEYYC
jgi:ABC-type microcin C transport system permease subunit YejE